MICNVATISITFWKFLVLLPLSIDKIKNECRSRMTCQIYSSKHFPLSSQRALIHNCGDQFLRHSCQSQGQTSLPGIGSVFAEHGPVNKMQGINKKNNQGFEVLNLVTVVICSSNNSFILHLPSSSGSLQSSPE